MESPETMRGGGWGGRRPVFLSVIGFGLWVQIEDLLLNDEFSSSRITGIGSSRRTVKVAVSMIIVWDFM